MRQIGSIESDRDAERFSDYLLTRGVGNMVEEQGPGGTWAVWVENDDHLDRGRSELEQFRANPSDAKYAVESKAERIREQSESVEKHRQTQYVDVRTRWSQPKSLARPVMIVLAAISIIVSIAGTKLGLVPNLPTPPSPLANAFYIAPVQRVDDRFVQWEDLDAITKHGQVWRLITPIFLHFNVLHLVFNMFWLLDLGSMIETRRGSFFLLIMVLVTAAASNVAQYYLGHLGAPSPLFGGMSGVNYVLFGYAWMQGKFQPHRGIGLAPQTITVMLFWLVLCMTGLMGPVANVAHVVGLIGGVAFGYAPYAMSRLKRGR